MQSIAHNIHEKSIIIPIKRNLSTEFDIMSIKGEYSLKQNFFDPNKSSPPNNFMIKLHMRVSRHNISYIKDSNCESE